MSRVLNAVCLLLATIFIFPSDALPATPAQCNLEPLDFPGNTLVGTLRTLRRGVSDLGAGGLRLLSARVEFSAPRYDGTFGKEVVDPNFILRLDATPIISEWEATVRSKTDSEGCSSTRGENFRWNVQTDGSMRGEFHIRHTKRACYWLFGDQKNHVATIEADAWQDFRLAINNDGRNVALGLSGGATDNVPDELEFLAKLLGNLLALEPISSLLLELDEKIFAALKEQRDAMEELSRFRLLGDAKLGGLTDVKGFCLDLLLSSARFEREDGKLVLQLGLTIAPANLLSHGQACMLRAALAQQRQQFDTIGVDGIDYVVERGNSAWSIAERFYGDGRYYPLLSVTRDGTLRSLDRLSPGEVLRIEPIGAIKERPGIIIVEPQDNLSHISSDRTKPSELEGLVEINRRKVEDPDLIYPLQILSLPPGATVPPSPFRCEEISPREASNS